MAATALAERWITEHHDVLEPGGLAFFDRGIFDPAGAVGVLQHLSASPWPPEHARVIGDQGWHGQARAAHRVMYSPRPATAACARPH